MWSDLSVVKKLIWLYKTRPSHNLLTPDTVIYSRYLNEKNNTNTWKYSADSRSIAVPVEPSTTYLISGYGTSGTIYRVSTIREESLPSEEDTTEITTYQNTRAGSVSTFGETHTLTTDEYATYMVIQLNSAAVSDFVANGRIVVSTASVSS